MKKRNGIRQLIALVACLAWGPALFAADKGSQFGVMFGFSVPDADNTNAFHVFGVKGQAFIIPTFSAGGYYLVSDKSGQKDDSNKFNYTLAGVESAYHIPAANGDTFIAFRMGMSKVRETPSGVDCIFSPYHYGIATGYDFYFTNSLSVGFEGSYLHVLPGRSTLSGTDYQMQSFNIISFLLSLQLRL